MKIKQVFSRTASLKTVIFLMGAGGMIGQLLLIRVLLIVFLGNELTLALIIASWLLFESAGAYAGGKISSLTDRKTSIFAGVMTCYSLLLPVMILLARGLGRGLFGLLPGETFGFINIFFTAIQTVGPVSLLHGMQFPLASDLVAADQIKFPVGRVYLLEITGTVLGGLFFTFYLVPRFTSLQITLALISAHLLLLSYFYFYHYSGPRRKVLIMGYLALALLLTVNLPLLTENLQQISLSWLWPAGEVVEYHNSPYGNISVLEREGEYTINYDGSPLLSLPVPDIAGLQDYAYLAGAAHPDPENVLVIGGGLGGLLDYLLDHPLENLVYAELDPDLVEITARYTPPQLSDKFEDPRLKIKHQDGRLYLSRTQKNFDLIMLGEMSLDTLQANRFFTREFFDQAAEKLADRGMLIFTAPGSLTYLGGEMADLNSSLYQTADDVFTDVMMIPGEKNIFIAGNNIDLPDAPITASRLEERGLLEGMFTPAYLEYRFDTWRITNFTEILREREVEINQDFRPAALFHGLRYWGRAFAPETMNLLRRLLKLPAAVYFILAALLLAFFRQIFFVSPAAAANRLTYAITGSGITAMSFDLLTLFAFQALYGYIYQLNGLFIVAFMGGMFAGGRFSLKVLESRQKNLFSLFLKLEVAIIFLLPLFGVLVYLLREMMGLVQADSPSLILLAAFALFAGGAVGAQFPLAINKKKNKKGEGNKTTNQSEENNTNHQSKGKNTTGQSAGRFYAADLLGGWLGGLTVGLLLFPLLGLAATLLILMLIKLSSLLLLYFSPGFIS